MRTNIVSDIFSLRQFRLFATGKNLGYYFPLEINKFAKCTIFHSNMHRFPLKRSIFALNLKFLDEKLSQTLSGTNVTNATETGNLTFG